MIQICPACDGKVELPEPARLCEVVECPECSSELEVVSLDPVQLTLAPDIEEDWGE